MFEIVKGLPVPEKVNNLNTWKRANKYPFADMEMGDCLKFNAENQKDPMYKKIYGSALSYARRVKQGYTFRFAMIEPGVFGCWKVESKKNHESEPGSHPKPVRKRQSTMHISKDMLIHALESDGSLIGAATKLNISTRTLSRLKQKFELV